ncbi:MAG: hypothetical protein QOG09_200 [Solirubrobacterales bacterium]|jgi:Ca2+-binding RTX toxin-like protein|nr:hypothetical protein [Solirubrobacterales bacterium]
MSDPTPRRNRSRLSGQPATVVSPAGGRGGLEIKRISLLSVVTLAVLAATAAPASARVSCSYADEGLPVLPQGNALIVQFSDQEDVGRVVRSGTAIKVFDAEDVLIPCSGGAPTVDNTDTIRFAGDGATEGSLGVLDLAGGPLAPGPTAESDGSSEIETQVHLDGVFSFLLIKGSAGPDYLTLGRTATVPGANLNPAQDGASGDSDVELTGVGVAVESGKGNDRVTLNGGSGFDAPLAKNLAFLVGGRGADRLTGGSGDEFLDGGSGRDRLAGLGGQDYLLGGSGNDSLKGGHGRDILNIYGEGRDHGACGGGRDMAFADRHDHVSGCERTQLAPDFNFF